MTKITSIQSCACLQKPTTGKVPLNAENLYIVELESYYRPRLVLPSVSVKKYGAKSNAVCKDLLLCPSRRGHFPLRTISLALLRLPLYLCGAFVPRLRGPHLHSKLDCKISPTMLVR